MATPQGDVIALTGDARIDYLAQGSVWQLASDRVVTYSFDQNFDAPSQDWTADWTNAVTTALDVWSVYANVHFVQAGSTNAQAQNLSTADLAIALQPDPDGSLLGLGFFPDPAYADFVLAETGYSRDSGEFPVPRVEGDITYNSALIDALDPGSMGFEVLLHEIGHALGLKHPDDDGGNGRPVALANSFESVMWSGYVQPDTGDLATPSANDVLAIQHLYGANPDYHGGDDVYVQNTRYYWTLWDTGGIDTLMTAFPHGGTQLNLEPGVAAAYGAGGTLVIAYGVTIENAVGGAGADNIHGNDAANRLEGGPGNDSFVGAGGRDTVLGGGGNDTMNGSEGAGDSLMGGAGDDWLTGSPHGDFLSGGDGDDFLAGEDGIDTLVGGAGNDHYFAREADVVRESAGGGIDWLETGVDGITLAANVENLSLLGDAQIATGNTASNSITGSYYANVLHGMGGDDTLDGQQGKDTLDGGFGDDSLIGGSDNDKLDGGAGNDTLTGLDNNDRLTGGAGDDSLVGGNGADILDGGPGADVMVGGLGSDTYLLQGADSIVEALNGGTDTVKTPARFVLTPGLENLTLLGTASVDGVGNDADNVITGNSGANQLTGNDGKDELTGGAGDDKLSGGAGDDILAGGDGDDVLNGGEGFDRMEGGAGDDLYVVDSALPAYSLVFDAQAGAALPKDLSAYFTTDTGTFHVEWLYDRTGDGLVDFMLIDFISPSHVPAGSMTFGTDGLGINLQPGIYVDAQRASFANLGHPGIDITWGGWGANTQAGSFEITQAVFDYGGAEPALVSFGATFEIHPEGGAAAVFGSLNYNNTGATDTVVEEPGGGDDTLQSSVSARLPAEVERLVLTGSDAIDGQGNALDNNLRGNGAANLLAGGLGNDTLSGGGGADTFAFDTAPDRLQNFDRIGDFSTGDVIRLDGAVFASLGGPGVLASDEFLASSTGAAADENDFILYNTTTGVLYYDADGNGAGAAVRFAVLAGAPTIDHTAFTAG